MCEYIVGDRFCKIASKGETYCHIHKSSSKLLEKLKHQSAEITILNRRLSEANRRLKIIDQADRIKYELAPFSIGRSFRQAIDDPSIKEQIESIFNAPQHECINIYDELLNKRNMLTHRYTARDWRDQHKKTKHSQNVKQLVRSIKAHTLLRRPLDVR